jgi:hypothetical protein
MKFLSFNVLEIACRIIVGAVVVFSISGCQKFIDHFFTGHHKPTSCRITSIKHETIEGVTRSANFFYSDNNNLDSVIFDESIGSAGAQLHYFYYDAHHRLVGYNAYYDRDADNYFFKHTYKYDENGRIVRDTIRISQAGRFTSVFELDYDNQGRVMAEYGKVIEAGGDSIENPEVFARSFDLDIRGNRLFPNLRYDEKTSFLSTNKVLMFTERNYSINNPLGATAYNDQGLPLGFGGSKMFPVYNWGIFTGVLPSEIFYSCSDRWDY